MEITCLQMDVLISFYLEGDLSEALKEKVQEHLKKCPACRAKFNIINSLFSDLKKDVSPQKQTEEIFSTHIHPTKQYQFFKNNLSAYIDNELSEEENIKMKKYTITNKNARRDLEDTYQIRKLMQDSFKKTKSDTKSDFSKNIMKQINSNYSNELGFNPLISVAFAFIMSVLLISAIVIYVLSL